ncbi:MAG TPA: hypothetical protein VFJ64_00055 [Solirubrobacterales bacterium]|nr:hypothetical protein [Solirubrobacterales bacterium]
MSSSKLPGLGLALVLVALASVAPSSARGDEAVMCKAQEEPCLEENTYPVETKFSAQWAMELGVIFETSLWKTRCVEASLEGVSTALTGGEITSLSFPKCVPLQETPIHCNAAKAINLPYGVAFITNEENSEGLEANRMRMSSGGGGDPGFKFDCEMGGFKFWCAYTRESLDMGLVGGEPAEMRANYGLLKLTGSSSLTPLCTTSSDEMAWYAQLELGTPSPLFFSGL